MSGLPPNPAPLGRPAAAVQRDVLMASAQAGVRPGDPAYPLTEWLAARPQAIEDAVSRGVATIRAAFAAEVQKLQSQAARISRSAEEIEIASARIDRQLAEQSRQLGALAVSFRDSVQQGVRTQVHRSAALLGAGTGIGFGLALLCMFLGQAL